jgi:DNA-binding NarL/FixJ family response regulator
VPSPEAPVTLASVTTLPAPIRVLVADDQRLVRSGLALLIGETDDLVVVGEAADGVEAVERTLDLSPDVVLMDIRMPRLDGLAATRTVLARTSAKVLILTTFDSDEHVYEALRLGASGFLLKDCPADQLLTAIRSVAEGDVLIDPAVTRRLIGRFTRALRPAPQPAEAAPVELASLTVRELDVLRLLATGLSNAEIARRLVVEDSTVKTHVGRILTKLDLRDRVQAVVLAYETGLVRPGNGADDA